MGHYRTGSAQQAPVGIGTFAQVGPYVIGDNIVDLGRVKRERPCFHQFFKRRGKAVFMGHIGGSLW